MKMHREAERRLLEEGITSYVPAYSAILAFRTLVETQIRQVLEDRLEEYGAALGVSLDKGQILTTQTSTSDWDGTYAVFGLELRNLGPARSWFDHLLYWEVAEDGTWTTQVGVLIWVRKRYQVEQLRKAIRPHPPNLTFSDRDKEIWFSDPITPGEAGNIGEKLDNVLTRWIKLWKNVGGLSVLSDDSSSED